MSLSTASAQTVHARLLEQPWRLGPLRGPGLVLPVRIRATLVRSTPRSRTSDDAAGACSTQLFPRRYDQKPCKRLHRRKYIQPFKYIQSASILIPVWGRAGGARAMYVAVLT